MAGKFAELQAMYGKLKDNMADQVANLWDEWNNQRQEQLAEWQEQNAFVFATDTSTTSAGELPWKNSTTTPKLCQIRDNLHSNYISSLFPNENWLRWMGDTPNDQEKARKIESFMRDKAHQSRTRDVISHLVYDYIDYGNVFATVEYVRDVYQTPDGRSIIGYEGPRPVRIAPEDIVFNIAAPSFYESPKIVRSIKTIGELEELAKIDDKWQMAWEKSNAMRGSVGSYTKEDVWKATQVSIDGFGDLQEYYGSNYVEILTFKGDIYDPDTGETMLNQEIIVVDRSFVAYHDFNKSWLGNHDIVHVGWRKRPNNLYGMGPLTNLIGMQYRIDHLENLKADAMDLLVHPPLKIIGDVEPFEWGPNAEISIIGEGDVQELGLGMNGVISAQNEIAALEAKMEEYAGAPKQAMGIRTPGEKTAFEVQQLGNAAGRIFQEKITNFEINILEPLLNLMLAEARRNFKGIMSVRVLDDDTGISIFSSIKPEDLTANGSLRPIGARHFGEQATLIQNLTQLFSSPLGEMIKPHWSSMNTAKLIEDAMDLDRYGLVRKDVGLVEGAETQDTMNHLNQVVAERQAAPS